MSRMGIEDIYELSPLQQGMLLQGLFAPESNAQINQIVVDLEGVIGLDEAQSALKILHQRHPVLRTSFTWEDLEQPYQIVHRGATPVIVENDLAALTEPQRQQRLEAWLATDRASGFELGKAPLLRLALLRTGEGRQRMVWTFHHIILEGLSFTILLGEFWKLLGGSHACASVMATPPPAFSTYIRWLQRQDLAKAERYWRARLAGLRAATHLPIDRAGPGQLSSGRGIRSVSRSLSEDLAQSLGDLARRQHLTLNTIVQGAWALLLSRYVAQDDVVFGVVVSGRPPDLPDSHSMVGLFVNALPARVHVNETMPLAHWLRALQAEQVQMREFDFSALIQVQGWSEVPRGQPLFESLLIFENWYYDSASLNVGGDRRIEGISFRKGSDQPLTLDVFAGAQTLRLELLYEAVRFAKPDMVNLLRQLSTLLEGFTANPDAPLHSFSMIGATERVQLLESWNATPHVHAPEATLHGLFEDQADRTPDAVAVMFAGETVSYRELERRANRVAQQLRDMGVAAGSRVGVCVSRSVGMVVAILGVLKSGAAYVPMDAGDPRARFEHILDDAAVAAVVTDQDVNHLLPAMEAEVLRLDAQEEVVAGSSCERPASGVKSSDAAYVIYTSGSTGMPKGVVGLHRGMVNRLAWMEATYPYGANERCIHKTTLGFVDAVAELFGPLLGGVPLVVADDTAVKDPRLLLGLVQEYGVTRLLVVPSLLRALLEFDTQLLKSLPVQLWVTSGERLEPELEGHFHKALPWARLLNLYGSSEVSADVTWFDTGQRGEARGSLIGRPIWNTRTYVLDESLEPVPAGVPGELYVGGDGLAQGYLDQPELTAERFVADPLVVGERVYRTGDRVRHQADGCLEYLGRLDEQVKVRGQRLELGEVESVLGLHPGVEQAVVVCVGEVVGEERLVGYVVACAGQAPGADELCAYARRSLPEFMVPGAWVFLKALPLTPSGKVDRRALPGPGESYHGVKYVAPSTASEELLCGIWCELLDVERVGVHDQFLAIGGHSLLALRLVSRIQARMGVELSLEAVFVAPTVAELAALVDAQRARTAPSKDQVASLKDRLRNLSSNERETLLTEARNRRGSGS